MDTPMKQCIFIALCFLVNASAFSSQAERPKIEHPIIGTWIFKLPNGCIETYDFKSDGTNYVTSSEEEGYDVYHASSTASPLGFYKLTDTITQDNGKKDCSGSIMQLGHTATNYIKLNPSNQMMVMCQTESFERCFGPLIRKQVPAPADQAASKASE